MPRSAFKPNPGLLRQYRAAVDSALVSGALVVMDEIDREFESRNDGFQHGWYASDPPNARLGVRVDRVRTRDGVRRIQVVNDANRDGHPYPLYWELGHVNLFTSAYEEAPVMLPAMERAAGRVRSAMIRQLQRGVKRGFLEVGVEL